jgi:urease accessory protein
VTRYPTAEARRAISRDVRFTNTSEAPEAGYGSLEFRRVASKTVLAGAFAASPLRVLAPRNHGDAAWVFLTTFGGGMVDGDRIDVRATVCPGATALLGTQSATKVYRSPRGCIFRLNARADAGAALAIVPDPVVCFAGARYTQRVDVALEGDASVLILDGYSCGRAARGERWQFARFDARTSIEREGARVLVDATRLDAAHGAIADRMGAFDVVLSLIAIGPRFASVRPAMLGASDPPSGDVVMSASAVGGDGAIVRVVATRFEKASRTLRACFRELARILGDDPFARKW